MRGGRGGGGGGEGGRERARSGEGKEGEFKLRSRVRVGRERGGVIRQIRKGGTCRNRGLALLTLLGCPQLV